MDRQELRDSLLLYAVTDRHWLGGRTLAEVVRESLEGGVSFLQLREKDLDDGHFYEEAVELQTMAREYGVPFVVNDNVDIALRMDADGVHVGQSDMEAGDVRALLGPDRILGVSAQTVEQAVLAEQRGADYLGVGAVFPTGSKDDAEDVSFETLKAICEAVSIPVVAIGGITVDNTPQLAGSGICGIAVISAIYAQKDIKAASSQLKEVISAVVRGEAQAAGQENAMPHKIKGVIFDVDGVVLDSMGMWMNLAEDFVRRLGADPEENLTSIVFSMSMEQGAEYIRERYALDMTAEELRDGISDMIRDFYFNEVKTKPGAEELMKAFRAAGIKMTAATASPHEHIERALERNGLLGYIDEIFTCAEIGSSKHDPDIYFAAASHLGTKPEETLVFEDSLYALRTAADAGFHAVGVFDANGETDQQGMKETAEVYVKDLSEFEL